MRCSDSGDPSFAKIDTTGTAISLSRATNWPCSTTARVKRRRPSGPASAKSPGNIDMGTNPSDTDYSSRVASSSSLIKWNPALSAHVVLNTPMPRYYGKRMIGTSFGSSDGQDRKLFTSFKPQAEREEGEKPRREREGKRCEINGWTGPGSIGTLRPGLVDRKTR